MSDESSSKTLANHFARVLASRMNQPWAIKRDALAAAFASLDSAPAASIDVEDYAPQQEEYDQ